MQVKFIRHITTCITFYIWHNRLEDGGFWGHQGQVSSLLAPLRPHGWPLALILWNHYNIKLRMIWWNKLGGQSCKKIEKEIKWFKALQSRFLLLPFPFLLYHTSLIFKYPSQIKSDLRKTFRTSSCGYAKMIFKKQKTKTNKQTNQQTN